jgi:hypothetical protein
MDSITTFLNKISYKFPKGYPDMNNPKDKNLLFEIITGVVKENEEIDIDEVRSEIESLIKNISDPEELKQIAKYAKNVGFGNSMKKHLADKNLSSKDILFFQSLLSELGKTGDFAKLSENPPTFDLTKNNYFDQIPGFDNTDLKSLYSDMKDSIQGTVSLGPGEAFLSVFFNNVKKAESKGDLNIGGKEVELKSRTGASGAMVAPKYVVRGKADDIIKEMEKLINTFDLEDVQKEELKNLIRPKGTSWPYKIDKLFKSALELGIDNKKLTKDLSDEISSWYKNKLPMNFESYFTDNEFEAKKFIDNLATTLAKDYFEEHGFDGFMISDNVGNFKYYDGGDFIDAIGNDIIVSNPSDLVPRIKV